MYECIAILTEFRTGGGAFFFLVIQCFCLKNGKKTMNSVKKNSIKSTKD